MNRYAKSCAVPALLAAILIGRSEARPWAYDNQIPTATAPAPDSTHTKELKPTPFNFLQAYVDRRLRKRATYPGSVCGFIGGDVASPAVCSSNSVCLWDTGHGIVGCSATDTSGQAALAVYTTCVQYNDDDDDDDDNDGGSQSSPWVFTCRGDDECYRNTYERISGQQFFQWGCGRSDFATTVLTQPSGVDNQSARVQLTAIAMSDSPPETTSSTSSSASQAPSSTSSQTSTTSEDSTSSTTSPPSSTPGGGGGANTSSNTNPQGSQTSSNIPPTNGTGTATSVPDQGSNTNTGAIVGGVVGGIAGLALIGALLFLLRRRRKKEEVRRFSEASQSSIGPHDMGEVYEPKELDATGSQIPSELPGDTSLSGPSKTVEPVELPGSEVPLRNSIEKKV